MTMQLKEIESLIKETFPDAIVEIHNKTNARFVSGVSSRTDYLISSRKDTSNAKKAKGDGAAELQQLKSSNAKPTSQNSNHSKQSARNSGALKKAKDTWAEGQYDPWRDGGPARWRSC